MTEETEYCWSINGEHFGKWMKTKEEAIQNFYERNRNYLKWPPNLKYKKFWLVKRVELDPEDYEKNHDTREEKYCLKERKNGYYGYQKYQLEIMSGPYCGEKSSWKIQLGLCFHQLIEKRFREEKKRIGLFTDRPIYKVYVHCRIPLSPEEKQSQEKGEGKN